MALVAGLWWRRTAGPPRPGTDGNDHVRFELRHRAGHLVAVEGRLFVTGQNGDRSIGGFITPCGSDRLVRGGDDELLRELGLLPAPALPADPELLHDPLTGLPNRTNFERLLADAVAPPDVPSGAVGVVLLDLDRFKSINTSLGYGTGDMVLAMVAERLLGAAGDAVLVARSGGDEFLALFHSPAEGAHARASAFADRARHVLARPFEVAGTEVFLGASIGVALNTFGVDDAASLLANAESAMYQAKNRGGARASRPTASRCGSSSWTG